MEGLYLRSIEGCELVYRVFLHPSVTEKRNKKKERKKDLEILVRSSFLFPFSKSCNLLAGSEKDVSCTPFFAELAICRVTVACRQSGIDVSRARCSGCFIHRVGLPKGYALRMGVDSLSHLHTHIHAGYFWELIHTHHSQHGVPR